MPEDNKSMNILHMMVGLPRSGKSSTAKKLGFPVVCPDSIRITLHGDRWRAETEPLVWAIAKIMVESLFISGHKEVVVNSCNHTKERRRFWESPKWVIKHHIIDVDMGTCIARAKADLHDDLVPVIQRMAAVWDPPVIVKNQGQTPYYYDAQGRKCKLM